MLTGTALFLSSILTLAAIYAVIALALNLEAGVDGLWDLGVVSFVAVGAYTYTMLTVSPASAGQSYIMGFGLPMWVGVLAAGIAGSIVAFLIGKPTLKLKNEYFLITTFAFAEVIRQILTNERWLSNGVAGVYNLAQPFKTYFTPSVYPYILLLLLVIIVFIVYVVVHRLTYSTFGRSLKALRENEPLALTAGIRPDRFHIRAFVIAGFFAGTAGAFYVWYSTVITPSLFTSDITFFVWMAIVIGGLANNKGAIVGSVIFVLAGESLRFLDLGSGFAVRMASMKIAILGLILIAILKWRPQGILPEKKVKFSNSSKNS